MTPFSYFVVAVFIAEIVFVILYHILVERKEDDK